MDKYKNGIAFGVFDIFHVGHLRYLKHASSLCHNLYVGIRSDDLQTPGKTKKTYFDENIRLEVISSLDCVSTAFVFDVLLDNTTYWLNWFMDNNIDIVYVGEEWKNSTRWNNLEKVLNKENIKVFYIKRTEGISSSLILSNN